MGPFVQQLLNRKLQGNVATNWGTFREEDSNKEYLRKKREQSPNISTSKSGLIVSLRDPWLGASPDRLVYDLASDPPDRLAEFKNPYSARNVTIDEAVKKVKTFVFVTAVTRNSSFKKTMTIITKSSVPCIARIISGMTLLSRQKTFISKG